MSQRIKGDAIVVRDVEKRFPLPNSMRDLFGGRKRYKSVLHDVSLNVRRGELLGLLGPNGVGKTTLMKMMATLTLPDNGFIEIEGIDIKRRPEAARALIGYCTSDDRSFYFRLTARENLTFFGALAGLHGKLLEKRIAETLEQVGLSDAIDRRFGGFSTGMRQRLIVARALLADPPILFFDEPTRAIDPIHSDELRRAIRDDLVRRDGKTVVLATNILEEAWAICDRVAIVNHGTIVAIGPPADLDPGVRTTRYRIEFEGEAHRVAAALAASGCEVTTEHVNGTTVLLLDGVRDGSLNDLMRLAGEARERVRSFSVVDPSPIELFKAITTHGN
ncbi:MAG TPA: ABC transporter ATP-binding protein [Candidatus Acidoferrum sp.]|jgi:ABC-2 type transport system ATP-binding protein|nr:ABC transporter ATP-binding protein [Candidatus Acidoferrum sp.]